MHLYIWVSGNGSKGFSEMVMIVLEWTSKREYIYKKADDSCETVIRMTSSNKLLSIQFSPITKIKGEFLPMLKMIIWTSV